MKFLNLFKKRNELTPSPTEDFWYNPIENSRNLAGQQVSAKTAQRIAAVHCCKTAIAESIAMLPAVVMDEKETLYKKKVKGHELWELLRTSPNELMDSFNFFEAMQNQLLDNGNAYAFKTQTKSGRLLELLPLDSEKMQVEILHTKKKPQILYKYRHSATNLETFSQNDIFHIRAHSKDGLIGRTPIQMAAESIGFGLALQDHGNSLFKNGAFWSGILHSPFAFENDSKRAMFMNSFKKYMGGANAGKFGLLEQGVEYRPFQQSNRDAQFIEAKQINVLDICRLYRVPPIMCMVTEGSMSYSSIEQVAIMFIQYTIQAWATRWERAFKFQLLKDSDTETFVRFNLSALIRGDLKERTESIVKQLQYGLTTVNEARSILDYSGIEDEKMANEVLVSHNLRPISQVGQLKEELEPLPIKLPTDVEIEEPTDDLTNKNPLARSFEPIFNSIVEKLRLIEEKELKTRTNIELVEKFWPKLSTLFRKELEPISIVLKKYDRLDKCVKNIMLLDRKDNKRTVNEIIGVFSDDS